MPALARQCSDEAWLVTEQFHALRHGFAAVPDEGSGGSQPATSWTALACTSEGTRDPASALEVWPPHWRPIRMKRFLRTLSLVWNLFKAFRFYEFLRDHFDDLK